jgi:uncharacterized protein with HEPN domain
MKRDDAAVLDVLRAARLARSFVSEMTRESFEADVKTQSAVLHQLLVIGEAAKRVAEEFRAQHAHIPWRAMAGMRDRVIHAYDDVDLDEVWKTLTADLPTLIPLLEAIALPRPD